MESYYSALHMYYVLLIIVYLQPIALCKFWLMGHF